MITHEELLAMFVYEPETGLLRKVSGQRKPYPWRKIGKNGRYLATGVAGKTYYLHQLVWFYHHGALPPIMVDHKNRDTSDCRIENLRLCTNAQNQYNSKRKTNNRSGVKGVVFQWRCPKHPWHARLVVEGKRLDLGYFAELSEAAKAYENASLEHAGAFAHSDSKLNSKE